MSSTKKILLVEDDQSDVELVSSAFAKLNLDRELQVLNDGSQVLDYLDRTGDFASRSPGDPAFILLDIKMPKVDGKEVVLELKKHTVYKVIPIIILSSSQEKQDIEICYQLGVNAYVVKPFKFNELEKTLKDLSNFWLYQNILPSVSSFTSH